MAIIYCLIINALYDRGLFDHYCVVFGEGVILKLSGKLFIENRLVREAAAEDNDGRHNFRDKLEKCLIDLCAELDIPVPLWLKKNTRELAIFRKTFFTSEQFMDKVWFDKFEIKLG